MQKNHLVSGRRLLLPAVLVGIAPFSLLAEAQGGTGGQNGASFTTRNQYGESFDFNVPQASSYVNDLAEQERLKREQEGLKREEEARSRDNGKTPKEQRQEVEDNERNRVALENSDNSNPVKEDVEDSGKKEADKPAEEPASATEYQGRGQLPNAAVSPAIATVPSFPVVSSGLESNQIVHQNTVLVNSSIIDRLGSGGSSGLSSGGRFSDNNFWGVVNYYTGKDENDSAGKYDLESGGITVGYDLSGGRMDEFTFGFAFSFYNGETSKARNDLKLKQDYVLGSLYGKWVVDMFDLMVALHFGKTENKQDRKVAGNKIKGKYDSKLWGATLHADINLYAGEVDFVPFVEYNYLKNELDDFTEDKVANLNTYSVKTSNYNISELGGGIKLSTQIDTGSASNILLTGLLAGYHDFNDDENKTTISGVYGPTLALSPINMTKADKKDKERYRAGVGAEWAMDSGFGLGLTYDYHWNKNAKINAVGLHMSYAF